MGRTYGVARRTVVHSPRRVDARLCETDLPAEGWSRGSKLSPWTSIGSKSCNGWLQARERRSQRTAADLKSCRHKRPMRAVASKRPRPVGEPPDSDHHCWCKRSWKEYP